MRAGLHFDFKTVRKRGFLWARLGLVPCFLEALGVAGALCFFFNNLPLLAISCGFILAAASPDSAFKELVQAGQMGYGESRGVPQLAVSATALDMGVAAVGYTLFANVAVQGKAPWWGPAHAPLSLVFGVCGGVLAATVASMTTLWTTSWHRAAVLGFASQGFMFLGNRFGYGSAGIVAIITMAVVTRAFWNKGLPRIFAAYGKDPFLGEEVDERLSALWRLLAEPLMYGCLGASLDLRQQQRDLLPRALIVVGIGLAARAASTFLVVTRCQLPWKERFFLLLASFSRRRKDTRSRAEHQVIDDASVQQRDDCLLCPTRHSRTGGRP
eukprot:jgi/Botrbrau1/13041/Bobra.0187s0004.1